MRVLITLPWEKHIEFLSRKQISRKITDLVRSSVAANRGHPAIFGYLVGNEIASTMIRWLDANDSFTAADGSHPSDNLGGILALADYLGRRRMAQRQPPLLMRDVLTATIKAYEIVGMFVLERES